MQECFLPKVGGVDTLSLDHKVFLRYFVKFDQVNLPRYIFSQMIWALKESQDKGRSSIPYGRLLSKIFYQGGILNTLQTIGAVSHDQLGTMVGSYINAKTLKSMRLIKKVEKLESDLTESMIVSDLMDDFPLISKEDHPVVIAEYAVWYYKETGIALNIDQLPDTLGGAPLRIASKKKKSNKRASEAVDIEEASEPKKKKANKAKDVYQEQATGSDVQSIQDEVQDLEPVKILNKRTRSGKTVGSSQSLPPQPSISKKKRKPSVKKMKVSTYVIEEDEEIKVATDLVTKEVKRKKVVDVAALQKVLEIDKNIEVPAEVLLKESSGEQAQKVVELAENLQQLVVASELLSAAEENQKEGVTCSEAAAS